MFRNDRIRSWALFAALWGCSEDARVGDERDASFEVVREASREPARSGTGSSLSGCDGGWCREDASPPYVEPLDASVDASADARVVPERPCSDGGRVARPNMVVVLLDDHHYAAFGAAGHPFLETPHVDRVANEGVYFENGFVVSSVCSPSRATVLTGVHAHTHGVVVNNHRLVDDFVASVFIDVGNR